MLRVFQAVQGPPRPPSLVVYLKRAVVRNRYRNIREGLKFLAVLNGEDPSEVSIRGGRRGAPREIFVRSPLTGKRICIGKVRTIPQYEGSVAVFDRTPEEVLRGHRITLEMVAALHDDTP